MPNSPSNSGCDLKPKPSNKSRRQGIYWILTIPHASFTPYLPPQCQYIIGQLECGDGGYLHWQVVVGFKRKQSLNGVRGVFGEWHAELTRSGAALDYVWKSDTRVDGTQFELGSKPMDRASPTDWAAVRSIAQSGNLDDPNLPADVYIRCYNQLRRIATDYAKPLSVERLCFVFWGGTGTGKSRRAWEEAGEAAYPKDPRTKWFCGYRSQSNIVIDEFRGAIDIAHLLRWLDRYPVSVETKGGSVPLLATKWWITSNLHPREWYPLLDQATYAALERRITIVDF